MLEQLADALPPLETESPAANARRQEVARAMVARRPPRGPDRGSPGDQRRRRLPGLARQQRPRRLARPDQRPVEPYARTAIAQDRAFRAGVAALAKHRGATAQPATPNRARNSSRPAPEPEQQPDDDPIPHLPQFQPRDRHGNPIPLYRFRDMTPKQRRATYGDPYDTATQAIAIEEEDAAIAAQKAEDEAAQPTT